MGMGTRKHRLKGKDPTQLSATTPPSKDMATVSPVVTELWLFLLGSGNVVGKWVGERPRTGWSRK